MPKTKIRQKDPYDKFYTKRSVALQCIETLLPYTGDIDLFIEPSAGAGAFKLPESVSSNPAVYLDVVPDRPWIRKQDFFTYKIDQSFKRVCVFGNPPFGSRNALSQRFIQHAAQHTNVQIIAFILPEVYKKATLQRVFPQNFSLIKTLDLPANSFEFNGSPYHIRAVFQIWHRDLRESGEKVLSCHDFTILGRTETERADFFTFGTAPQNILEVDEVRETNRGHYIEANIDKQDLIERFKGIDWKRGGRSCVSGGAFWLTGTELIRIYESERVEAEKLEHRSLHWDPR